TPGRGGRRTQPKGRELMLGHRLGASCLLSLLFLLGMSVSQAQIAPRGNLDCNGFRQSQKPLRAYMGCTDFFDTSEHTRRYDNCDSIGHDEPIIGFYSTQADSGNNVQYDIWLPVDRKLPAVQSFELYPTFWFSMALCDPRSFPNGDCKPNSDENTPAAAG